MRADPSIRWAYVAALACLGASAVGFRAAVAALGIYLQKEPVPLRVGLESIPATLGRWKQLGSDSRYDDAIQEELGTKLYLNRSYALDGSPAAGLLELHIAYYTGLIDAVPHVPERCWGAQGLQQSRTPGRMELDIDSSGWDLAQGPIHGATGLRYPVATVLDPVTRRIAEVHLPVDALDMTVTEFHEQANPERRVVGGYLFIANGRATPSAYAVRGLAFSLADRYAYYCKVQFSAKFSQAEGAYDRYRALVRDLLREVLPHLMKALPDWPDYEGPTAEGPEQ